LALEGDLRWQLFWKRFSILGFVGAGNAWNDSEQLDNAQGVVSSGGGLRYEVARRYGIHTGRRLRLQPVHDRLPHSGRQRLDVPLAAFARASFQACCTLDDCSRGRQAVGYCAQGTVSRYGTPVARR